MATSKSIGERLKTAREAKGLTPTEMAAALGVHVDSLTRYEKGDVDISALKVWKASEITRFPFAWFAGEEDSVLIPEDLDRALLGSLLDSLDEHHRRYEGTLSQLRRLLGRV